MRPGAMWFIKDPQDQNSHPIRDILERPTFLQLRKIMASAVMYAVVVAAVVGSVAGLLLLGSKSIMPFRWKNRLVVQHTNFVESLLIFVQESLFRVSQWTSSSFTWCFLRHCIISDLGGP